MANQKQAPRAIPVKIKSQLPILGSIKTDQPSPRNRRSDNISPLTRIGSSGKSGFLTCKSR